MRSECTPSGRRADEARRTSVVRVLYAETDARTVEATRRHLEKNAPNIRVEVASSGEELARRIRHEPTDPCPCDVLLLECRMAGDALLGIVKILLDEGSLHVPVVMLGQEGDEQIAVHALRLGASVQYLVKHANYLYALPATLESVHRNALLAREQRALRESEDRYRSLFANMLEGFAYCRMVDDGGPPDFVYLEVNRAFEALTGLKDVVGKRVTEVIPGIRETGADIIDTYARVAKTGQPERFEYFLETLGIWFWVAAYSPAPGHFVAVFDNISERKEVARQLAGEKAISETLLMSLPGLVFVIDPGGRLVRWNRDYEKVVGRSSGELSGADALGPIVEEDRPLLAAGIGDVFADGQFHQAEGRLRDAAGEVREYLFSGQRVDVAGSPLLVGTGLDVTDRKRAEGELRRSEEKFRSYVENAPLAVFVADPGGRIVETNPRARAMLGYDAEQFSAMNVLELHPEEDREARLADLATLTRVGRLATEARMRRRDGTVIWVSLRAVVTPGGTSMAYCQDVTERRDAEEQRRRLEAQLQQAQKMEAVGRLAGGVAHDFNNMLSVILGYTELALRKLSPVDPIRENLVDIRGAAERSADLTRQLLAFSRRQTISPSVLDIGDRLEGMKSLLRRIIGEDVELEVPERRDVWPVLMDASQLDQVLANLAVNARDAMPDGGRLTIAAENATLDEAYCRRHLDAAPGDYVRLLVRDTGCGMEAGTLERVFEPFFTTKPEGKGTGLGLAMVYGIARQNGGSVGIESEVGRGTSVNFFVPRHRGAVERPAPAAAEAVTVSGGGRETVLLVEDEAPLRVLTKELLETIGYNVLAAASPGEALTLCEKHAGPIDLLLTDVIMPVMNGRELSERVASLKPGIRVLFTSGYTADVIAHRGVLDPGLRFLAKPFTIESLEREVHGALAERAKARGQS